MPPYMRFIRLGCRGELYLLRSETERRSKAGESDKDFVMMNKIIQRRVN